MIYNLDARGYMGNWQSFREMNTRAWAERRAVNNDCNGSGPHTPGEVRVMPHSNEPLHGNDILCRACWNREIDYRIDRNDELGNHSQDGLPVWADSKVYES